ncbi:MAG: hypothetical protein ACR2QO_26470 [Acidimicrobiales bacterium]
MERLFAAPNGEYLGAAVVALVARFLLGWIPLIGGPISFVLLLVAVWYLARVALNVYRSSPART